MVLESYIFGVMLTGENALKNPFHFTAVFFTPVFDMVGGK